MTVSGFLMRLCQGASEVDVGSALRASGVGAALLAAHRGAVEENSKSLSAMALGVMRLQVI